MKQSKVQTKEKIKESTLSRPPVVTIMGHVDHGKTTLLDAIRNTHVAEREKGGITQHIGAYQIDFKGQKITFIDTPGHAAFSAMRARGAKVTDLVILVVAADDGVMPQTKESISHIKASGVPFIVAANKMDAPGADLNRVKQQLSQNEVLVEEYGGDVPIVAISAKTKQGLDELLDMVILVCEVTGLKEEDKTTTQAVVIESLLDRYTGPMATVLIQSGKLRVGDQIVAVKIKGKIRALKSFDGVNLKEATVSMPVTLMGLEEVPGVGDTITIDSGVKAAEEVVESTRKTLNLDVPPADQREFRLIVKADVAGSLEAIISSIEALNSEDSKIKILVKETGDITESDVYLAASTKALILGFNVKVTPSAAQLAGREKVLLSTYNIIYELLDQLKLGIDALTKKKEQLLLKGKASVVALFDTSAGLVLGCKMLEGDINKGDNVRVLSGETEIGTARIVSMRHLKDEVAKVSAGQEFGISLKPELEASVGDSVVTYQK